MHLDTVLKCRGKHTEIGKVPFGVVRFSVLSRMNGKSGELLLVYSIRAYPRRYARRSKEKKTPWKGAKRPPGRWDVEDNQNIKVENKSCNTGPVMDDSKSLIPTVTLEKRRQIKKFSLTLCVNKYY